MKLRFPIIDRRRIIVIIALIAPFFAINMLVKLTENHATPSVSAPQNKPGASKDFPFLTLDYIRKLTAGALERAEKMTPEEYEQLRKDNANFPMSVEDYRAKIRARLMQLNAMTPKDWQEEVDRTVPPLRRAAPLPIKAPPELPENP